MATLRKPDPGPVGVPVPAELTDPDHPLWSDTDAYVAYMGDRGWLLPVRDRLAYLTAGVDGYGEPPSRRRERAVRRWAVSVGIVQEGRPGWPDVDWLRAMGLLGGAT